MGSAEIAVHLASEFMKAKGGELSRMETEDAARWMAKVYITVHDALQAELQSHRPR